MLNPMTQNFTRPYPAAAPGDFGGTFSAGFYQWKTQNKLKKINWHIYQYNVILFRWGWLI